MDADMTGRPFDPLELADALSPSRSAEEPWRNASAVVFHKRGRLTNQTLTTGTITAIAWTSMDARNDTGDIAWDATLNLFVIQIGGWYRVSMSTTWASNNTGVRSVLVRVNGATVAANDRAAQGTAGSSATFAGLLNPSDTVDGLARQTSGGDLAVVPSVGTWIAVERLAAL